MTLVPRRLPMMLAAGVLLGLGAFLLPGGRLAAEAVHAVPPPNVDDLDASDTRAVAVFAGGCFWGVQGVFQHIQGVTNAVSGYAGGEKDTARYQLVSTNSTGHAEAVQVTYDPRKVSYGTLLRVFFSVAHNPTELNRQGPDVGTQYRSAVFPQDADQTKIASAYIAQLNQTHIFGAPIATSIEAARPFFPAEAYHQNYLTLHPNQPYIAINDMPKIEALKTMFPDLYRTDPVLVPKTP